jgi:hypothetical protein
VIIFNFEFVTPGDRAHLLKTRIIMYITLFHGRQSSPRVIKTTIQGTKARANYISLKVCALSLKLAKIWRRLVIIFNFDHPRHTPQNCSPIYRTNNVSKMGSTSPEMNLVLCHIYICYKFCIMTPGPLQQVVHPVIFIYVISSVLWLRVLYNRLFPLCIMTPGTLQNCSPIYRTNNVSKMGSTSPEMNLVFR